MHDSSASKRGNDDAGVMALQLFVIGTLAVVTVAVVIGFGATAGGVGKNGRREGGWAWVYVGENSEEEKSGDVLALLFGGECVE